MNVRPECLDDDPADETCLTKPDMYIDPCAEEEYQDASFCAGDSDQGHEALEECAMDARSARGYCPGDEGHERERLSVMCSQPDNFTEECYDFRLEEFGDGYWGTDEGWYPETVDGEASSITYDEEVLPNAGFDVFAILLVANVLGLVGLRMIKRQF